MNNLRNPYLSARLQGFGTSVFAEITHLAVKHQAINLGQGFPDFDGPESIKRAAANAILAGKNQYCRTAGLPELCQAISDHQKRFWQLQYDPEHEITVVSGATEALFSVLQAICDTGDEVVVFEPYYDSYRAGIANAGAVAQIIPIEGKTLAFDRDKLERAITAKTKAILLNSPHNPSGKVFSREELEFIAKICRKCDLLAITDEVYEHLVFEGEHIPLASLPGMQERTVLISSAGKTFSFTGWKIGYLCAPKPITDAIRTAHQFVTFCSPPAFQSAIAQAFALEDAYYDQLLNDYRARRDQLCDGLSRCGLDVCTPSGTYFVLTDIRSLGCNDDREFCRTLTQNFRVAAIPASAFYDQPERGRHLVRWAFCKTESTLQQALDRLKKLESHFLR